MESRAEGEEAAAPWRGRGAGRLGLEGRGLGRTREGGARGAMPFSTSHGVLAWCAATHAWRGSVDFFSFAWYRALEAFVVTRSLGGFIC